MQKRKEVSSLSRGSRAQPGCPFGSCPHLPTCSQPDLQGLRFWGKLFQDQPSLCTCRKRSQRFPIQIVMALVMDADEQRVKKLKLSQSFPLDSVWILVLIRNYEVQSVFWTASEFLLRITLCVQVSCLCPAFLLALCTSVPVQQHCFCMEVEETIWIAS